MGLLGMMEHSIRQTQSSFVNIGYILIFANNNAIVEIGIGRESYDFRRCR